MTVEDLVKLNGEVLRKGVLNVEGDFEFWDDGSKTHRLPEKSADGVPKRL